MNLLSLGEDPSVYQFPVSVWPFAFDRVLTILCRCLIFLLALDTPEAGPWGGGLGIGLFPGQPQWCGAGLGTLRSGRRGGAGHGSAVHRPPSTNEFIYFRRIYLPQFLLSFFLQWKKIYFLYQTIFQNHAI